MKDGLAPGTPSSTRIRLLPWAAFGRSVVVDYHMHTAYTDGADGVQQMAEAAESKGIDEVLFTEHVRHTSTYYPEFLSEVRALQCPGLRVHVGVETKILDTEGHLDCSAEIASMCDAIIGSVHRPPPDKSGNTRSWSHMEAEAAVELEFQLALAIVIESRAHILAHPMGMAVKEFGLQPLERLFELACACRDFDKAFELNARYCSSTDAWIDVVRRAGCKVSFGSDAHTRSDVGRAWSRFVLEFEGA